MDEKLSGSYYTPVETVKFTYTYLLRQNKLPNTMLEPSAGDGRFIDEFFGLATVNRIVGIELYTEKALELIKKDYHCKVTIVTSDFLLYAQSCVERFQLIIGPPPILI